MDESYFLWEKLLFGNKLPDGLFLDEICKRIISHKINKRRSLNLISTTSFIGKLFYATFPPFNSSCHFFRAFQSPFAAIFAWAAHVEGLCIWKRGPALTKIAFKVFSELLDSFSKVSIPSAFNSEAIFSRGHVSH
jgi:hypothetical protein